MWSCNYSASQTGLPSNMAWLLISHLALKVLASLWCHSWSTEPVLNRELFVVSICACHLLYKISALLLWLRFVDAGILLQHLPTPLFDTLGIWQLLLKFSIRGSVCLLVSSNMWFGLYFLMSLFWSELDPGWTHAVDRKAHGRVSTCQLAFLIVM